MVLSFEISQGNAYTLIFVHDLTKFPWKTPITEVFELINDFKFWKLSYKINIFFTSFKPFAIDVIVLLVFEIWDISLLLPKNNNDNRNRMIFSRQDNNESSLYPACPWDFNPLNFIYILIFLLLKTRYHNKEALGLSDCD